MRVWTAAWNRYRRQNRFLVGSFLVLGLLFLGAIYLNQRAQVASPDELSNRLLLFVLWYLDVSLILVLLFILARHVFRLFVEVRTGVLGSRFRTKLVLTYVLLSVTPVILLFLTASNLLERSIDRWFSAPVRQIHEAGLQIAETMRERELARLERVLDIAVDELAGRVDERRLGELRRLAAVDAAALYIGSNLVSAELDARVISGSLPTLRGDLSVAGQEIDRWRGGLLLRVWRPLPGSKATVLLATMIPPDELVTLDRAVAAYSGFQELDRGRSTLKATTILVFASITLVVLFATVWVGLYLSRRLTAPIQAMTEATRRVAQGSELVPVETPASDEMAVLIESFNAMVARVRSSEAEIRRSAEELATLLNTVPTGVVTVDTVSGTFKANPAAARLLGRSAWADERVELRELDRLGLSRLAEAMATTAPSGRPVTLDLSIDSTPRHLELTARPLPDGGRVVALDDLTALRNAEHQAAWVEVAQRIAHEIKNPLTPIRLAAERIERRCESLSAAEREVVEAGCRAIVAHVSGLKELVDAFHLYARMPQLQSRSIELDSLVDEVVDLYQGLPTGLRVYRAAGVLNGAIQGDSMLLRQALVNLIDNALEAVGATGTVVVDGEVVEAEVVLRVLDDGPGLPTEDASELVKPFYSTKGRGSGMGLAMVHRVVSDHGGSLRFRNRSSGGTEVEIRLPKHGLADDASGGGQEPGEDCVAP